MVFIAPFIGAAAFFTQLAWAAPRPLPDGHMPASNSYGGSYGNSYGSSYGSSGSSKPSYEGSYDNSYGSSGSSKPSYEGSYDNSYDSSKSYGNKQESNNNQVYTTEEIQYTSTSTAQSSYQTPSYGSGSSNWESGSGYDDCVQQCVAKYGAPSAYYKPTATAGYEGSSGNGNGVTHTIIVAPTQGVLRYVPFAVNASIGDTLKFMWGANNHTVTKGSALLPCNKTGDAPFASGLQTKDFVFTQVVNTTDPTYFYCAAPTHCQKGMFGIINPPQALDGPTSASGMMQDLYVKNPDLKAYAAIVDKATAGSPKAANWGGSIDIGALPEWAHELAAENIMYTRNLLGVNPEIMKDDGIDLSAVENTPLLVPEDVVSALSNAAAPPAPAPAASSTPTEVAGAVETSAPAAGGYGNSASGMGSPRILVALMAVVLTIFVL